MARLEPFEAAPEAGPDPSPEINTRRPSGVNFKRLAWFTETAKGCDAFLLATSMMVTVPSCALAAQISFPPGDTSKPSEPRPDGTLVISHVLRVPPGGGPAFGGGPPPGGRACGGNDDITCSMMLIVPEFTLEVKIRSNPSDT